MFNMSSRPNRDGKKRLKKFIEERYQQSISNIANFTPDDIESRMYRRARKNPGYSESRSLKFDPWEQHKAMKEAKNQTKYNVDNPTNILKKALIDDRVSKGHNRETETLKAEKKLLLAFEDPRHLQDIVDYLNQKPTYVSNGEEVVINDRVLKNIAELMNSKQKRLNCISPEILHHITTFENLNNLKKGVAIEDDETLAQIESKVPNKKKRQKDYI